MTKRRRNEADICVGNRVRAARLAVGMTQENFGSRLGVTFQQVQKYERGVNRISAGSLFEISAILQQPIPFFFEDIGNDHWGQELQEFIGKGQGIELSTAFMRIKRPGIRQKVLTLIESLATTEKLDPLSPAP